MVFVKDASLSRRLSKESAHADEVHRAWPSMMSRGLANLTTVHLALEMYRAELIRRLRRDTCVVPHVQSCCVERGNV